MIAGLVEKFRTLYGGLTATFVEREAVIEGMLCAALAGEHVLLLGPPGAAKSALARALCGAVSGTHYFEWLLSRFSAPEELYGPMSLQALKDGKFTRVTTGKLPEAEIVFLDEIWKANAGILNSLLAAINERVFHNNGQPTPIPLRMMVGASNELPEGPELAALYDRFLMRYWVDYVQTQENFVRVVMGGEDAPEDVLSLAEWDAARALVAAVTFDTGAALTLHRLKVGLEAQGVAMSDRRFKRCVKLLKANAWMSGDDHVQDEHFSVLADALWNEPAQRVTVATEVQKVAASLGGEATKIADTLITAIAQLSAPPSPVTQAYQNELVTTNREGNRALQKLKEMAGKARSVRQKESVQLQVVRVQDALAPLRVTAREALGL